MQSLPTCLEASSTGNIYTDNPGTLITVAIANVSTTNQHMRILCHRCIAYTIVFMHFNFAGFNDHSFCGLAATTKVLSVKIWILMGTHGAMARICKFETNKM